MGCGHEFHTKCLFQWLQKPEGTASCPCCRREPGEMERVVSHPIEEEDDEDEEDDYDEELDNFEEHLLRMTAIAMGLVMPDSQIGSCATKIQTVWRGFSVRRQYDVAKILTSL